jgi:hypothetical protein
MPGWKINCLKSEDGTNPSNTTEQTNKTESIPSSIDHQNTTGKSRILSSY